MDFRDRWSAWLERDWGGILYLAVELGLTVFIVLIVLYAR